MGLFESVKRLHDLELYEDLLLFANLQLAEHRMSSLMAADEQAYVYACVGDAHRECGSAAQGVRFYEKCLKQLASLKRQALTNRFDQAHHTHSHFLCNQVEIRYRLHKALLADNRLEEALKCLEAIPRATADPASTPPKVAYAIARLSSTLQAHKQAVSSRSSSSTAGTMSSKVAQHLKSVVDAVPDAESTALHVLFLLVGIWYEVVIYRYYQYLTQGRRSGAAASIAVETTAC